MDILHGKTHYLHIANMTGKPDNLPKFMRAAYASRAPICIIQERGDELQMLKREHPTPTHCNKFNSNPAVSAVRYGP